MFKSQKYFCGLNAKLFLKTRKAFTTPQKSFTTPRKKENNLDQDIHGLGLKPWSS
jgi:hypothetical protein